MDIKGHSTMIIAMAIAVVVMTGVMVPVISDALDNAGGGLGSNKPYEIVSRKPALSRAG